MFYCGLLCFSCGLEPVLFTAKLYLILAINWSPWGFVFYWDDDESLKFFLMSVWFFRLMQITLYCLYIQYAPNNSYWLRADRIVFASLYLYNEASSRILQVQNPCWGLYYLRAPAGILLESWRWVLCTALRQVWKGNTLQWYPCGDVGQSPGWCCEKGPDGWRSGATEPLSMLISLWRAGRCRWLLTWQPLWAVVFAEVKRCDVDSRTASVLCATENPAHVLWERGQWPF